MGDDRTELEQQGHQQKLDDEWAIEDLEPDAEATERVKGGGGDAPTESFGLNFAQVQFQF